MTQWQPGTPLILDPLVITPDTLNIPPLDLHNFTGPGLYGDGHNWSSQVPGMPLDYLGGLKNLAAPLGDKQSLTHPGLQITVAMQFDAAYLSLEANYPALAAQIPTRTDERLQALLNQRLPNGAGQESQRVQAQLAILQQLIADNAAQRDQQLTIAGGTPSHFNANDAAAYSVHRSNAHLKSPGTSGRAKPFLEQELTQLSAAFSARLLSQAISHIESRLPGLQAQLAAAQQVEEAARQLAQQQAEEAARKNLEAQRLRNGYALPDTTSLASFSAMGGAAIAIGEASINALQAAIRTATTGLAAAAVGTSAALASVVGALTLLWPADVADSERRLSLSVPLKDLAPPGGVDWATVAALGGSVDLPYVMLNETHGDQTKIVVAKSDGALIPSKVRVFAAQFDAAQNLYTVQLDSPPRTLVWRPLKDPGTDTSSSTALPGEPSKPLIYSGATLEVIDPHIESYPALDGLGVEQIIVDFPIDSGLERVLIMFKDRRLEPGVATGNGGAIEELWLGEQSRGLGAAIPTRIADQLRDKEFKTFNNFREAFWKAVAAEPALSAQFNENNLTRMRDRGYAPKTPSAQQHKSQISFILHHVQPIAADGGVYDMDNIRIVTPAAHQKIHSKVNP